ncbi:hypothetical protein ACOSZG_06030 [Vibrio alginolyticus]|uniref:hypothetical protein n=1 Tax=Vibrio alginolyticus TaxID=663 RepID=UPI003BA054F0
MHSPLDQLANFARKLGFNVTAVVHHDWDNDPYEDDDAELFLDPEMMHPTHFGVVSRDYITFNGLNFHPHVDYKTLALAMEASAVQLQQLS